MKIILTSANPSKKRSLENALVDLGLNDYEITCVKVDSDVPSKPIGYEIIRGADNRNQNAKNYALKNKLDYDYLCSIEGGFSLDENGLPFVVTYVIMEDKNGKKSTGKSLGIRIRKDIFDFVKNGGSLNELIGEISNCDNNKQNEGITGFLTGGLYSRSKVDKDAIVSAFIPFLFKKERDLLSDKIASVGGIHE